MDQASQNKDEILKRLRKIEGQVKGIQRMVEDEKGCLEVLTQLAAVKAAVISVGTNIVKNNTTRCLEAAHSTGQSQEYIEDLVQVLMRFAK
ncbi:MAG: metal-sensitive transcriptional regulator [Clostridia bacterium]|nr:metal-sensitive transcriptional regulator [Clostridia bacterium]